MSNKFTSRERIAMIVVAGVVAIAIAALALQRSNQTVPVPPQSVQAPTHAVVSDKPDTVKTKTKHRKRKAKAHSSRKSKTKSPMHPHSRDYFTSPENE